MSPRQRRLAAARAAIETAREHWDLARSCAGLPIESTYYKARAHAALYAARRLLKPNSRGRICNI